MLPDILAKRGLGPDEAARFVNPTLRDIRIPASAGFAAVVDRLQRAVEGSARVGVFGDYDADGVTSAVIVSETLGRLGCDVVPRVADRTLGYGFTPQWAREFRGCSLIVVLDCGTRDRAGIASARESGADVAVLDHHVAPDAPVDAVLANPRVDPADWPDPAPCSAGIALMACIALCRRLGRPVPVDALDVAAIGTVADMVPLRGVNRAISRLGLVRLRDCPRPGLRALIDGAGVDVHDGDCIGWRLAPRINAPGRLGSAEPAFRLLVSRDWLDARVAADRVIALNETRKELSTAATTDAVVQNHGWFGVAEFSAPAGISGLVATRLRDDGRTMFAVNEGGAGSARGPGALEALTAAVDAGVVARAGGHPQAAGFRLPAGGLPAFVQFLRSLPTVPAPAPEPSEPPLVLRSASLELAEQLDALAPYGVGNPRPVVSVSGRVTSRRRLGKGDHASFIVAGVPVVAWNVGDAGPRRGDVTTVLGKLGVNRWAGRLEPRVTADEFAAG